jgi:hypothetical protein
MTDKEKPKATHKDPRRRTGAGYLEESRGERSLVRGRGQFSQGLAPSLYYTNSSFGSRFALNVMAPGPKISQQRAISWSRCRPNQTV